MFNLDCYMVNVFGALFLMTVEICLDASQVRREEDDAPSPLVTRAVRVWVEWCIHTIPSVFPSSIRIHGAWSQLSKLRHQSVNLRCNDIFCALSL